MEAKPLVAADLLLLKPQPWQCRPEYELTPDYCEFLQEHSEYAQTIWHNGQIVAAGGAVKIWENRAEVWMLLSADCGRAFVGVNRIANAFLDSLPYRRIETTCEQGFEQAHRWLSMLRFRHECTAQAYMPDGRDIDIYVRIK